VSTDFVLPGPDTPIIDESRLMTEFGDDPEIIAELRDLFQEHAPPLYESISQAVADQDLAIIARDAHCLKGACATYGAPRLAMVCKVLELSAKNDDWGPINEHLASFRSEYEQVLHAIGNMNFQ